MPNLIYSMTASADGFVKDLQGDFGFYAPTDDLFQVHLDRVAGLGGYLLGRRLYEDMRVWETDPAIRGTEPRAAFADVWTALPKVVFSRTLEKVEGNARLATGTVAEEVAAALATGSDFEIGGADLARQAIELDLVDEFRLFRAPVLVGGGTPYFPPLERRVPLEPADVRSIGGVVSETYRRVRA